MSFVHSKYRPRLFAEALHVSGNRNTGILSGQRGVSADTALRLSRHMGTTAECWLNLQKTFELRAMEIKKGKNRLQKHIKPRQAV